MTINGFNIKKYRARVKDRSAQTTSLELVSADGYKIVEGYASISQIILPYGATEPQYVPIFVAEEINFSNMPFSGLGMSAFTPVTYGANEFEIIGEIKQITPNKIS